MALRVVGALLKAVLKLMAMCDSILGFESGQAMVKFFRVQFLARSGFDLLLYDDPSNQILYGLISR